MREIFLQNTALLGAALLRSTSGAMAPPATPFAGNNLKAQPETFLPCKRDSANIYQDCFRDPLDFRSKATVQRQWSLPSCHPTALELQRKLDAALADVASERTAKEAAEKAAAELQSATHRLQQQLETAQNRADSLQVGISDLVLSTFAPCLMELASSKSRPTLHIHFRNRER